MSSKDRKEIRFQVDAPTHAAVAILAKDEDITIDRWVGDLVHREVAKRLNVARKLSSAISEKDLVQEVGRRHERAAQRIYFIQRGTSGPIKIGAASNVERRLTSLQCACSEPLHLLHAVDQSDGITERSFHRMFRHLNRGGEWFAPDHELLNFIAKLTHGLKAAENGGTKST